MKERETHRNKRDCFLHKYEPTIKYVVEEYVLIDLTTPEPVQITSNCQTMVHNELDGILS